MRVLSHPFLFSLSLLHVKINYSEYFIGSRDSALVLSVLVPGEMRCGTCQQRSPTMSVPLTEHRSRWPANPNWVLQPGEHRLLSGRADGQPRGAPVQWLGVGQGLCEAPPFQFHRCRPLLVFSRSPVQLKRSAVRDRLPGLTSVPSATRNDTSESPQAPWPLVRRGLPCLPHCTWHSRVLSPFGPSAALLPTFVAGSVWRAPHFSPASWMFPQDFVLFRHRSSLVFQISFTPQCPVLLFSAAWSYTFKFLNCIERCLLLWLPFGVPPSPQTSFP